MLKNILLAVNPQLDCRAAAAAALALARQDGATVSAVVLLGRAEGDWREAGPLPESEALRPGTGPGPERLAAVDPGGEISRVWTADGFPSVGVARAAWRSRADMVIFGFDARGGCRESGSDGPDLETWTRTIFIVDRAVRCPVMVVDSLAETPGRLFARPLAATDLSPCADCGVDYACRAAAHFHGRARVVHFAPAGRDGSPEDGTAELASRYSRYGTSGARFFCETCRGDVAEAITAFGRRDGTDVYVVAHRHEAQSGPAGESRLRLGGLSRRTMEAALRPSVFLGLVARAGRPVVSMGKVMAASPVPAGAW